MREKTPQQITEFYKQLDSILSFDRWDLMKQLNPLSEVFEHEWNIRLNAENICLRFFLKDGNLSSDFYSVDEKGKEVGFPTFNCFSEEQINYIIKRSTKTKNPLLIAHYNHILLYIKKNRDFGIKAIEAYKRMVTTKLMDENGLVKINSLSAVINLTEKIKYEKEKTKRELINLLMDTQREVDQKLLFSKLIINSSLFKSHELKFFPYLVLNWISKSNTENYSLNKEILLLTIKVCINNQLDTSIFYEKLAENEFFVLKQHPKNTDFLRSHILGEIIEYYKKSKNDSKYKKYLKEYTKAKSQIELPEIDVSPDQEAQKVLNEELNRSLKIILSWDLAMILNHYSVHSPLFPDIDKVIEVSKENYKKSFLQHASRSVFDINNNVKSLTNTENIERDTHFNYQYSLALGVLPEFIRVLQIGTYNRKISYNTIYDYLARNTWLGQNFKESKMRSSETDQQYNWLNLMAPGLHSLFIQLETSFLINKRLTYTNWVLPLDSLTLKFEGALREFIKAIGGNTSILKNDDLQEMLLDDLLNCEPAKIVFTKHDLTLFKMIFTKKGENIRHNVAHGFYHPKDYNIENCCKVLLCILRLSNYKLASKPEQ